MLDKTTYTTTPAPTPHRVLSGNSISKTKTWTARDRAALAARWVFGLIEVSPTIKAAAGTFGVSVPYVQEAIADLKDVGHLPKRNGNGHGNDYAVVHDYAKLPFIPDASDLWSHMTDGEREAFVRGHLLSVWDAVERVTA